MMQFVLWSLGVSSIAAQVPRVNSNVKGMFACSTH